MLIKITGKNKALEDLEKAQKLIKEAEQILYRLPLELGIEVGVDINRNTTAEKDSR